MKILEKGHIIDTALEDYSLDHLAEPELEVVEEHILICPTCQDRLAEIDDFVRAFRLAHGELEASEKGPGGTRAVSVGDDVFVAPAAAVYAPASHPPGHGWFQRPAMWAGLAFAVVLLAVAPVLLPSLWRGEPESATPVVVNLVAQRGAGIAEAPEGRLALQLDLRGVNDDPLIIEVAAWDGRLLWHQTVGLADAIERVTPGISLPAGQYWVRVRAERDPTLLREFGLRVVNVANAPR